MAWHGMAWHGMASCAAMPRHLMPGHVEAAPSLHCQCTVIVGVTPPVILAFPCTADQHHQPLQPAARRTPAGHRSSATPPACLRQPGPQERQRYWQRHGWRRHGWRRRWRHAPVGPSHPGTCSCSSRAPRGLANRGFWGRRAATAGAAGGRGPAGQLGRACRHVCGHSSLLCAAAHSGAAAQRLAWRGGRSSSARLSGGWPRRRQQEHPTAQLVQVGHAVHALVPPCMTCREA